MILMKSQRFLNDCMRNFNCKKCFSITPNIFTDENQWIKIKEETRNVNKTEPFLSSPDYSFKDGRPVPYGSRQKQRILKQMEYTAKIIQLTKEVDFAVERHQNLLKLKENKINERLSLKLKPKGYNLLKQKKNSS